MKCYQCSAEMKSWRETRRHNPGLINSAITLEDVEVRHCPNCGDQYVSIQNVQGLNRFIALRLVLRPERLNPEEVKFLRNFLHLTQAAFATRMGVTRAAASRWEKTEAPLSLKKSSERLLRLLVARQAETDIPLDLLDTAGTKENAGLMLRLRVSRNGTWREVPSQTDPSKKLAKRGEIAAG